MYSHCVWCILYSHKEKLNLFGSLHHLINCACLLSAKSEPCWQLYCQFSWQKFAHLHKKEVTFYESAFCKDHEDSSIVSLITNLTHRIFAIELILKKRHVWDSCHRQRLGRKTASQTSRGTVVRHAWISQSTMSHMMLKAFLANALSERSIELITQSNVLDYLRRAVCLAIGQTTNIIK